jgi:hypothetical protein
MLSYLGVTIPAADIRLWYNRTGKVKEVNGYLAIKTNINDQALQSIVGSAFSVFTNCAIFKEIKIVKGIPSGKPRRPRKSYPFQFDPFTNAAKQN